MQQSMNNANVLQKEDIAVFVNCIADKNFDDFLLPIVRFANLPFAFLALNNGFAFTVKASVNIDETFSADLIQQIAATVATEESYCLVENCLEHPLALKYHWAEVQPAFRALIGFPLRTKSGVTIGCVVFLHSVNLRIRDVEIGMIQYAISQLMNIMELTYQYGLEQMEATLVNRKFTHDLRNPLTVISLNTEILSMEPGVSQEVLDMCGQIKNATKGMNDLIETFSTLQKKSPK